MLQVHGPKKINKNKEAKKNRQRPWEDISPKELHKWLINKRCLISLIIKNKQISTTLRYNYIPSKMVTIKNKPALKISVLIKVWKTCSSWMLLVGEKRTCCHCGKETGNSSRPAGSSHRPVTPRAGTYPEGTQTGAWTWAFPAALFTGTKRWKPQESTEGWTYNKVVRSSHWGAGG